MGGSLTSAAMPRRLTQTILAALVGATTAAATADTGRPLEPHQRLATPAPGHAQDVALTLDACGGAYDAALIGTLIRHRVPATLFVTRKWLQRNPGPLRELLAHPDLFELQNHGALHLPAVIGRSLYGMPGQPDAAAVAREVSLGAQAVADACGHPPGWYRGAGAAYDTASLQAITPLGARIAGFSLNADDGATARAPVVAARLLRAQPGDIILAHMNHPASGTAAGIAQSVPELLRRGLRFVKLSQAAGVVDVPPPARGKASP